MSQSNRGLGKGLSALFSDTEEDYGKSIAFDEVEAAKGETVQEIEISKIYANPNQPRKVFEETALKELAQSIKEHGVIMPIIVNRSGERFMIIAGERRYRASIIAGLYTIPAIVKNYSERQVKEISLIENLQREDLNPIEAANAMKSLMNDYGLTQEDLADRLGKSRSAIANTLRLLNLAPEVMSLVESGKLSAGHARALVAVPQIDQKKMADAAVKEGLSVREMEKKVKDYFIPPEEKIKPKRELSPELKELIGDMQRTFGTKVNAIGNDNKGRIYIDYYTRDDLDRLGEILEFLKNNRR